MATPGVGTQSECIDMFCIHIFSDQSNFVGFSVYLNTYSVDYDEGDLLKFNRKILNTNYYNTTSGQFTCPVTGIYLITFTLSKYRTDNLYLSVQKQDTIVMQGIDTNEANDWTTVTNSRLVECVRGERMVMRAVGNGKVQGGGRFTTFSGMLVATDGKSLFNMCLHQLYITAAVNQF